MTAIAPTVASIGVHIVDILGRPVTDIPPGQGGRIIEEIRVTAAGTAAGTSVDLAKLGASVSAIGVIGTDTLGDLLVQLLSAHGVDTTSLVRRAGPQTSATILPIRPNGDRPAFHVPGANATMTLDDVDLDVVRRSDAVHLGGIEVMPLMAGDPVVELARTARRAGAFVSLDVLSGGSARLLPLIAPVLPFVDAFLPNAEQLEGMTGCPDPVAGARAMIDLGTPCVGVTLGAAGSVVVTPDGARFQPAFDVPVVDTTGCGDSWSAGFIMARLRGESLDHAALFGNACAALTVQGLGSDAGIVDLVGTQEFLASARPLFPTKGES